MKHQSNSTACSIHGLPVSLQALCEQGKLEASAFNKWAHQKIRSKPAELQKALDALEADSEQAAREDLAPWLAYWRGWLLHDHSDFSGAVQAHVTALACFEKNQDILNQAKTLHAISGSLKFQGFFDRALDFAERGLKAAAAIDEPSLMAAILANIGETLIQLRRYQEADAYLLRALEYHPSESARLVILMRQTELSLATSQAGKAMDSANRALHLAEQLSLPSLSAQAIAVHAKALAANDQTKQAKGQYARAIRQTEKAGDRMNTAEFLLDFGQLCMEQADLGSAQAFFDKSLTIASELKALFIEGRAHSALAEVCSRKQEWQAAYQHQLAYTAIQQKLSDEKSDDALRSLVTSQALQEAETYKKLYDRVSAIAEAGREISTGLASDQLLENIYQTIQRIMPADIFGIALKEASSDIIDYKLMIERGKRLDAGVVSLDDRSSIGAWCCRKRQDLLIHDLQREAHKYVENLNIVGDEKIISRSMIFSPLIFGDRVIGLIMAQSYEVNAYNQHDLEGLRAIGLYVAIALENASLTSRLDQLAANDPLTGVLNRQAVIKAGILEHERRYRYGKHFSIVMLAIDNLKFINATFGHSSGDTALRHAVTILRNRLRSVDTIGRYGGE
ncbi:MAG: sensor domain-containing diguanylate cyclase, partial [Spirochaetes bacterium]|nr:sensor domain-containing diguanylate cyclase [Spirochaetota bacterium]MBU0953842.1 sensor domain-containing diguanylate cyclase [Spirochaetota bacterium]